MTDAEKLEWACWVLDQHHHRGQTWLAVMRCGMPWAVSGGDDVLYPDEAIAIALALDEQARRKLPDTDQTDWACSALNQRRHGGHARWNTMKGYDGWLVFHLNREYSFFDALAIAESLIRRELLGDTP